MRVGTYILIYIPYHMPMQSPEDSPMYFQRHSGTYFNGTGETITAMLLQYIMFA